MDVGNLVSITLAAIAVISSVVVALINRKTRGPADARDDMTAENEVLKSAAEVAMGLVDKTKAWADHLINAMQSQIDSLSRRVGELEHELSDARETIRELRAARDEPNVELAAALERERLLRAERDTALRELATLRKIVRDSKAQIDELTLNTDEIRQHRDGKKGAAGA